MNVPISYLARNGRGYYLQKRVPKDLLAGYPTQTIKRYLSADYDEARRMLPNALAALEREFAEKRAEPGADLSPSDIDRIVATPAPHGSSNP